MSFCGKTWIREEASAGGLDTPGRFILLPSNQKWPRSCGSPSASHDIGTRNCRKLTKSGETTLISGGPIIRDHVLIIDFIDSIKRFNFSKMWNKIENHNFFRQLFDLFWLDNARIKSLSIHVFDGGCLVSLEDDIKDRAGTGNGQLKGHRHSQYEVVQVLELSCRRNSFLSLRCCWSLFNEERPVLTLLKYQDALMGALLFLPLAKYKAVWVVWA